MLPSLSPATRRGGARGGATPAQALQKLHARSSGFPQIFALTPVFPGRSVRDRCPLDLVVSLDAKPYRLGSHRSSTTRAPARRHRSRRQRAGKAGKGGESAAPAAQREYGVQRTGRGAAGCMPSDTGPERPGAQTRTHQSRRKGSLKSPGPQHVSRRSASRPFRTCWSLRASRRAPVRNAHGPTRNDHKKRRNG